MMQDPVLSRVKLIAEPWDIGPGGYRFTDYLKLGIPLNLLVLLAGTLFIPHFWPF